MFPIPPLLTVAVKLAKPLSFLLGGGGFMFFLVGVTSLAEHVDVVTALLGVVFGILLVWAAFWLKDWKKKIEDKLGALETETRAWQDANGKVLERHTTLLDHFAKDVDFLTQASREDIHHRGWVQGMLMGVAQQVGIPATQIPPLPRDSGSHRKPTLPEEGEP